MTRYFNKLHSARVLMVALFLAPVMAQAATITFEDAVVENLANVAQGYKGFQWGGGFGDNSWILVTPTTSHLNFFSAHSGTNYIWSNNGTSLKMSDGLFDFNSMWVRIGGSGFGTVNTAHGFLGGVEIYNQEFAVVSTYSEITLNFLGIDAITFDAMPQFNLVMDDININAAAVPEPATLALVGLGLLGLGFGRRRK